MRKIQIGVMGSAADLQYGETIEAIATEIGMRIAQNDAALVFGAEKDCDSLSTVACRAAKEAGGMTIGVTYGKDKAVWEQDLVDIVIVSGLERGGGRETPLVLSCDAAIAISGGSGTLTELAIAYQADIPMVALTGVGGWSERLAGEYLDDRRRRIIHTAQTAKEAVDIAIREARSQRDKKN